MDKVDTDNRFKTTRKIMTRIDQLNTVLLRFSGYLVLPLILVLAMEIVLRVVFKSPTNWSYEVSRFFLAGMFLLAGAGCFVTKTHIVLDFVVNAVLSERLIAALNVVTYTVLFLPFVAALTSGTINQAIKSVKIMETTGTVWNPPYWPMRIVIAISMTLILIQGITIIIREGIKAVKGVEI